MWFSLPFPFAEWTGLVLFSPSEALECCDKIVLNDGLNGGGLV